MDFARALSDLNAVALIVAALAALGLAAYWYSPKLFAQAWAKELGWKTKSPKAIWHDADAQQKLISIFVQLALLSLSIGLIMSFANATTWSDGLATGLIVGLGVAAATQGVQAVFEKRSRNLLLIDITYSVLACAIIGAILGAWPK